MAPPSVYDHVRPATESPDSLPDRTYRVVGVGDDTVTLLAVTDVDGRRTNTGHVRTVDRDAFAGFRSAPNPDESRPLGARISSAPSTAYWSARAFLKGLAARPLASTALFALVCVGAGIDAVVPGTDEISALVVFVGTLGLVFVANGRL